MTDNVKLALVEKLTPEMARDLLRDDQTITREQLDRLGYLEDTIQRATLKDAAVLKLAAQDENTQLRKLCDELAKRLENHDSCYHLEYGTRDADHAALTAYNQFKKGTP